MKSHTSKSKELETKQMLSNDELNETTNLHLFLETEDAKVVRLQEVRGA